jgi:hypothetical protein
MYLKSEQSGRNSPKGYANYRWKEQQSLKGVKKICKKIHKVETGEDFGMAIRGLVSLSMLEEVSVPGNWKETKPPFPKPSGNCSSVPASRLPRLINPLYSLQCSV